MGAGHSNPRTRLAEGRQVFFRLTKGWLSRSTPPDAGISRAGDLVEIGIDLFEPNEEDDDKKKKKKKLDKFAAISRELEVHFTGKTFKQDLSERLLYLISSPEMVLQGRGGMDDEFLGTGFVPNMPEWTGVRHKGSISVSMREYPKELGLASYFLQIPLEVFSAIPKTNKNKKHEHVPPVPLEDLALNLAAHLQYVTSSGGIVQQTPAEDKIFNLGLAIDIRYLNIIRPVTLRA